MTFGGHFVILRFGLLGELVFKRKFVTKVKGKIT